ncbi:MAG: efflux RND transporter permease subunit, partial [Pseudomonadota bacterium]
MADQEMPRGIIVRIVHLFLISKLPILFILFSIAVGAAAIFITPREEEPQIIVPMADVYVQVPGASPREVENLAAVPLERLLWQIDGVEHVYSSSARDMAVITVRFFVGEDRERSLVKLYNKLAMNADQVPPVVQGWIVKPVEIDDVPIVNLALYSEKYDDHQLRRVAEEVVAHLSEVQDISRTYVVGGRSREVRVELMPERMQGMGISMMEVEQALGATDRSVSAGSYSIANRDWMVISDSFVRSRKEVENLVVGVFQDRPVYLRDVGRVLDGPEETGSYTRVGFSHYYRKQHDLAGPADGFPAVTIALAKKRGKNAVWVADEVLSRVDRLKEEGIIPPGISVVNTRNYGASAQVKVDDLLSSLLFAILTVVGLLVFTMGRREALVVAVAVPVSFSLALFVNYMFGYTINRVTLFALILSLGLVVDDPITNVDNIQRHILMRRRGPATATLFAVHEVLPPVIMSTLAIIISFTPLFFITGMMGPYMSPMAANVPLTVAFSTLCALTIVPWMSFRLLRHLGEHSPEQEEERDSSGVITWIETAYEFVVG